MKKIALTLVLGGFVASSFAQTNALGKYFSQYQDDDRFTRVHVSQKAFELLNYIEVDGKEAQDAKKLMESFESLNVLVAQEMTDADKHYKNALKTIGTEFEELISVDEKESHFRFLIDEKDGVVYELLMIGTEKNEFILASITGKMALSQLSKFASMHSTTGMKHMQKMPADMDEVKVVPNPVPAGAQAEIQIPTSMENANITIYDMQGQVAKSFVNVKDLARIEASELSSGYYIVHMEKDGVTIKNKFLVK